MAETIQNRKDVSPKTPMMEQYFEIKDKYEEYILMYRLGDFYECFFDDALIASRELELTLTSRDCGEGKRAAMCGVPFFKADEYIEKLVAKGYMIAICEQVEDPKAATGIVKRDVVRIVTPGTVTEGSLLKDGENNYLAAVAFGHSGAALAYADISTGEVSCTFFDVKNQNALLLNELSAYAPAEIIFNCDREECKDIAEHLEYKFNTYINASAKRLFDYDKARECVRNVFKDEYSKLTTPESVMAVGALAQYAAETQKTELSFVNGINSYSRGEYLEIDINTRRNLELTETMRAKEKRGSLLGVLDKTKTAMGARLLRNWLLKPLINPIEIRHRQDAVNDFYNSTRKREELRSYLSDVMDLERLTARAVYGRANAKDLRAICESIKHLPDVKDMLDGFKSKALSVTNEAFDTLSDVCELLDSAIVESPPFTIREGGMIKEGFNAEVDDYRNIRENGAEIMKEIEEREKEETGIRTLKVSYNKVFGYYIEVSKSFINDVPDRYIRKQTLTNCERYITQELKEMETTIFGADEKLIALEYEIFTCLRNFVADNCERILKSAAQIAELDVYSSLAEVASKNSYICPEVDLSSDLYIKDGRHPVVEKFVRDTYFVPNDTQLDTGLNRIMIITGPNMAGKSTYMRQVALITIMAQIGSFVPAREAKIGIVDKVFTRVGASDDLALGHSTFMLEMNEVALILKNATNKSLIIYDEVGRGTSTYDGMAIARAVVEYTHSKKIGARTLFATHYHELTDMEDEFEGIVNYNIAAKKRADSVIFLRKIVRGGTDDSYGIEVAKLAGVPSDVVKRAKEILKSIEDGNMPKGMPKTSEKTDAIDLFSGIESSKEAEAADKIRSVDLNTITPIEAMNVLFEIKKTLQ